MVKMRKNDLIKLFQLKQNTKGGNKQFFIWNNNNNFNNF